MEAVMQLSRLSSAKAIRQAVAEYDRLGRAEFLSKYGFRPSTRYFLVIEGKRYDSKAIFGAAWGYQYPKTGPLSARHFSGGQSTVAKRLDELGFKVHAVGRKIAPDELNLDNAKKGEIQQLFDVWPRRDRRKVHRVFADAISYCNEHYPAHWTLNHTDGRLRLIVGMVMVLQAYIAGLDVLMGGKEKDSDHDWRHTKYRNAPGCLTLRMAVDQALFLPPSFGQRLRKAIDICASHHPGTSGHRSAYSTEALAYLRAHSPVPLAQPSWVDGDVAKLDARVDRTLAAMKDLPVTEREALRRYRCAQGLFRDRVRLMEKRCRVTKVADQSLLIASHIKPWADSDDAERQDKENGLLLAPHVDVLFDRGMISFGDDGALLVRGDGERRLLKKWRIPYPLNVGEFTKGQKRYLAYHRQRYGFA
jgi:hypothetical protein